MDATCTIQDSIHVFSLVHKYVSRILGTYQIAGALFALVAHISYTVCGICIRCATDKAVCTLLEYGLAPNIKVRKLYVLFFVFRRELWLMYFLT